MCGWELCVYPTHRPYVKILPSQTQTAAGWKYLKKKKVVSVLNTQGHTSWVIIPPETQCRPYMHSMCIVFGIISNWETVLSVCDVPR